MNDEPITDEDLSGPVVDRRTTLKLFGIGAAAAMAGCTGQSDETTTATTTEGGDGGDETTEDGGDTGGEETTQASQRSGGELVAGWNLDEIPNLDPPLSSTEGFKHVSMNVFNALLRATPDFEIHGDAAKDWTINDGTQYVFTLREGMQFQKGYGEVTAQDVKYSFRRGLELEGSQVAPNLAALEPIDDGGVVVRDDYTVEINLKERFAPFLKYLTRSGGACQIMPQAAIEELGAQYKAQPVGAGPFEIAQHEVGSSVVLERFDEYWETDDEGTPLPYLDQVTIKPIPEASTLVNAIRSGDIRFINKIPFENVDTVKAASGVNVFEGKPGGWEGLYFNLTKDPWKDNVKLRRGIAKVIDREAYINAAFLGNHMEAVGPIGPIDGRSFRPNEEKPDHQKTDREEGERLIEESGAMGSKMSIMVWKAGVRRGRALSQQLGEYFDVEVNSYDYSTYLERLRAKPGSEYYDVTPWGSDIDVTTDETLYRFFKSPDKGGAFNRMGYSNEDVDRWLEEERQNTDPAERAELFRNIEDQIIKDAPVAFTHHYVPWQAAADSVDGYTPHPTRRDLTRVWLPD